VLFGRYFTSGKILSGSGPMWFALALLGFCAVLTGVRLRKPAKAPATNPSSRGPGPSALLEFGALLAVSTFLVRLVQPIGTNVLNFQLCFFPQYIAAFAVGVAAGKHGWLDELATSSRARIAGWLGCLGGPLVLAIIAVVGGAPPENGPDPYAGGWNGRAFALTAWEQFAGLGIALGSMAWFHRRCNSAGRMATWLSERAFAVYLLHAPVLVALTPLLRPAAVHPFVGAGLLTVTGLFASFAIADVVRRLPGLRRIL
jgi:glucans biosynthesis protein C